MGDFMFPLFSRILHWTMAAMILAMLGIGFAMVVSLADYGVLVSIHRPLGIAILALAIVRLATRLANRPPPLPETMAPMERLAATASEYAMYGLMFALPLVGWAMLSAARYPIVLCESLQLPDIVPHDLRLHAVLRRTHTVLAYLFFLAILAHFGAILFHALIVRDGILARMAIWPVRARQPSPAEAAPVGSSPSPSRETT
jgi:cytochrome b561